MDVAAELASRLFGRRLVQVERRDYDWSFVFAKDIGLRVECPWRIVVEGRIWLGRDDHAQKFGLPAAVDGEDMSRRLTKDKLVRGVTLRDDTGDLTITFDGETALEVLNMSSGYEGWEIGANGMKVIAMGGGQLAIFRDP
jgi:Family of unknown function (DUF6188)